jgi:hypothetical protein
MCENVWVLEVVIKVHKDDKTLRFYIEKVMKNMHKTCEIKKIKSISKIKNLGFIHLISWTYSMEICNEMFKESKISIALLQNNVLIPSMMNRYKIFREYHETAVIGYRERNKTYNKIAKNFY